jgi:lipopolysaccharide export system protein LptA
MIFMMQFTSRGGAAVAFALALIACTDARAQGAMSGVPNAKQGF